MIPILDKYKEKWKVESDDNIKPGLQAIKQALALLDNPQEKLKVVHVAGTNGKGSTITFLEQISLHHGLSVGKFMSPCIVDVHDQIQVNGNSIKESQMDQVFQQMKDVGISGLLTDFELLTVAAFLHFVNEQVDLVLLETGLGGLEDSTNVVNPIVSVITSIALEHTKFLGNTIESIARHKAGIIKLNQPVVIGKLPEEALEVVKQKAQIEQAFVHVYGQHFQMERGIQGELYQYYDQNIVIDGLNRIMPGDHQGENMALAITAFLEVANAFHIKVNDDAVREAVNRASLPARFEQIYPNVYIDGAHNPASAEKLVKTIGQQFPNENIRFVVGMVADKDIESVLRLLEKVSDEFYFVDFKNSRAALAKNLYELSKAKTKEIVEDSVSFIRSCREFNGITIVTGSLYLLAEIRKQLKDGFERAD